MWNRKKKKRNDLYLQTLYAIIFHLRSTIKADHSPVYRYRREYSNTAMNPESLGPILLRYRHPNRRIASRLLDRLYSHGHPSVTVSEADRSMPPLDTMDGSVTLADANPARE